MEESFGQIFEDSDVDVITDGEGRAQRLVVDITAHLFIMENRGAH